MAMYSERDTGKIDEIHHELQNEIKKPEKNIMRNIPTSVLLFFGGAIILILYFSSSSGANMNKTLFAVTLVIALVILIGVNKRGGRLLAEQECKIELYQQLKFKQRYKLGDHKELPEGTIKIAAKGRLRFFSGEPWKRQIGFSVITQEGYEHQYSAELNPYTGDIIGLYEGYFDPKDVSDIIYIPSPQLVAEKRYSEYGGKIR